MKKIYTYISVFALAVLALGCSKEVDVQDELPSEAGNDGLGETITVTLSVPVSEESDDTKTTLGAKSGTSYPVLWSAGDVITLNGTAATEFTPASGNATATAKFKVTNLSAPYNFLYKGVSGQSNQVTFPASQAYVANGFDPEAMPMYASVNSLNGNITFSHVASLLKFSITGEKKIDSVTLTATDGNMSLSGTFTIGATDGILNGSLTPASGGGAINYNFGSHIQLSEIPFVFYVAIPAGYYEGGIALEILDNDSGHMNVAVLDGASNTLAAGKVVEFDNITYIPAKENNLKQIWNATTFQEFVTAVAGGNKTLNARLTPSAASIDLSSIASSFESIEDYKGTFDGNGKTLSGLTKPLFDDLQGVVKNLTLNSTISTTETGLHWGIFAKQIIPSLEIDDVPGLQNCTASGSITWTPASALSNYMTLGGLVGNNKGGTITGCTNNASVTFASSGVTHTNQPSVGGVVGRTQKGGDLKTQGDISNCNNYGTVTVAAQFSQGAYIGGVLGYQVEKAETMSGCVNHGLVKVTSTFSTSGALHLGGIAGLAKGTIENCTNASDGTVTSEDGSTAGTYICQGGVVGRLNREADTYSTLSNAGNINVAASGASTGAYIGGVAGRCNEGASISSCTNTGGTIEYTGDISTCELHIGGIVGKTNKAVSNCTNATSIVVSGSYSYNFSGKYLSIGGIVGYQDADYALTDNSNTAAITFSGTTGGYLALAGICGYCKGIISGGGNSGTVTYSGASSQQNIPIGGIVARTPASKTGTRINGVANSGDVIVNTSTHSGKYLFVGGIIGDHQSGDVLATNSGAITVSQLSCTQLQLGGLIGQNQDGDASILSGSANYATGDITISNLTSSQQSYIGGVVGKNGGPITANNAGDITVASTVNIKRSYYLGGITGRSTGALSSCTNSGIIDNSGRMSGTSYTDDNQETQYYYMEIGGIVGYNNPTSTVSSCHNTGDITNTGNSGAYLLMGGISGENDAAISYCDNTGDVTNSGGTSTTRYLSVGGIVGDVGSPISYCSNGTSSAAGGTISNGGTSAQDIQVAGVAAYNTGYAITSCYNKGDVINSGNTASNRIVAIGGIAGWSNNGSSYVGVCYNTGAISNSGAGGYTTANKKWDAATFCVRMGGLVGCAEGANTIAGTSASYSYNNGPVTESSTSKYVAVGGVCGWANSASTDFAYCRNNSDGDIVIQNNERINVVVGGILGMAKDASVPVSYTRNAGTIEFNSLSFPSSGANQGIFAGGILGVNTVAGDPTVTITHCYNEGNIQNHTRNWSSQDLLTSYDSIGFSYVGGIVGGGDKAGYKYEYCYSRGDIYIYSNLKMRVGGIAAYSNIAPENCAAYSDVYYMRQYNKASYGQEAGAITTKSAGDLGGIIAYCNTSGPFNNLTFYGGTLISRGGYPAPLGGGILGDARQSCTFSNCNVAGGTISGSGSNSAGLFCATYEGGYTITFDSCVVKTSTKHVGANTVTISSASDLTEVRVLGNNSGTISGDLTVGSVTNPLANGCPFD